MTMKKLLFSIMALGAMMFTSCEEDAASGIKNNAADDVKIVFDIKDYTVGSRAVKTAWEAGDQVKVYLTLDTRHFPSGAIEDNQQVTFTYDGTTWTEDHGSLTSSHFLAEGKALAVHYKPVTDDIKVNTSTKYFSNHSGVVLTKSFNYTFNSSTSVLNLGTIALEREIPQMQVVIPGIDADDYYIYVTDKQSFTWSPNNYYVAANNNDYCANGFSLYLSSYIDAFSYSGVTSEQPNGITASDGATYVLKLNTDNCSAASEYHFMLAKKSANEANAEMWDYVVEKTAEKSLKNGSAIKLPALTSGKWTKVKDITTNAFDFSNVTVNNPFTNFPIDGKTNWAAGDRINFFTLGNILTKDPVAIMQYDGTNWNNVAIAAEKTIEASSTLFAVYEQSNDITANYTFDTQGGTAGAYSYKEVFNKPQMLVCQTSYTYDSDTKAFTCTLDSWKSSAVAVIEITNLPASGDLTFEILDESKDQINWDQFYTLELKTTPSFSFIGSGVTLSKRSGNTAYFYLSELDVTNQKLTFGIWGPAAGGEYKTYTTSTKQTYNVSYESATGITTITLNYNDFVPEE